MKRFRVAREGKTVDGREITRDHIDQMAANYDPAHYGARIWIEHFRSLLPDSPFRAHGDVVSLSAEDDKSGKRVLLAELDPLQSLLEINKSGQKVYSSVEIGPDTEGRGVYLYGLAVTDSPASTGTEVLKFSRQDAAMPNGHMQSELLETTLDFSAAADSSDQADSEQEPKGWLAGFMKGFAAKPEPAKPETAPELAKFGETASELQQALSATQTELKKQADAHNDLLQRFNELHQKLENTPEHQHSREPETGTPADPVYDAL